MNCFGDFFSGGLSGEEKIRYICVEFSIFFEGEFRPPERNFILAEKFGEFRLVKRGISGRRASD